ncbi:urea transporter [Duganella sp. HH105]|uniref:urea transporter n=1 Tax=Duganella sp. HH105 TaxID=1781067 RepID=UPI00089300E1|nr:urea transporter [Duganella sp. HH105]OEZ63711.1 urea transporter [Duganella sp. HH105]
MILSSAPRVAVPLVLQRQLTAIGQIYFQDSPIFGTVLLLCLYLSGPVLALGCVLGAASAALAAWASKLPAERRDNGLYSCNGALTGIGLCASYQFGGALLLWIAAAGALTAALTWAAERARIPPLTLPFVLMMWFVGACAGAVGADSGLQGVALPAGACGTSAINYLFCSVGQAAFIGVAPLGMLLWAAMARRRWHMAMWGLSGAALSWLSIALAGRLWPGSGIEAHVAGAGINSTLCMLALSTGSSRWPLRLAAAWLSIALSVALGDAGLAYYTLPFILATWLARCR